MEICRDRRVHRQAPARGRAIILAKVNLGDFASTAPVQFHHRSDLNPHNLSIRPPLFGGTGAGLAAWFAPLASAPTPAAPPAVRRPSMCVGLKPTHGLLSARHHPVYLHFDTAADAARAGSRRVARLYDRLDTVTRKPRGARLFHTTTPVLIRCP